MRITIKRHGLKYILRIKKFKKKYTIIIDGEIEYYYSSNGTCYLILLLAHILIFPNSSNQIKIKRKFGYKIFYFDRNALNESIKIIVI